MLLATACSTTAPAPVPLTDDDRPAIYATAFVEVCSGRCRDIDTVYVVDPGGSLGDKGRAAIRQTETATPFFVETMDSFLDEDGHNFNGRWSFTFSKIRDRGNGLVSIDVSRATSRFDFRIDTIIFRRDDGSWIRVDPEEVGITVTTGVA